MWGIHALSSVPSVLVLLGFYGMQSVEHSGEVLSLRLSLEKEVQRREQLDQELRAFKSSSSRKNLNGNLQKQSDELLTIRQRLEDELKERERLEAENQALREQMGLLGEDGEEVWVFASLTNVIPQTIETTLSLKQTL